MNHEFRVWDIAKRKMYYIQDPYRLIFEKDKWYVQDTKSTKSDDIVLWHTDGILMQGIKMSDINKKTIFEGDVVDCKHWADEDYDEPIPSWIEEVVVEDITYIPRALFFGSHKGEREVVGNIYENPNLAQGGK